MQIQKMNYYKKVMYEFCKKCIHFDHELGRCEKGHKPAQLIEEFFTKANKTRLCEDYERSQVLEIKAG